MKQTGFKDIILFVGPSVACLFLCLILPLVCLFAISFTNLELGAPLQHLKITGFDNYQTLLSSEATWQSCIVTLLFIVCAVSIETVLGLGLALALAQRFKGDSVIKTCLILPMMLAPIVVGLIWRYLFDTRFGIINVILAAIKVPQPLWLADQFWAFIAILITDIWQWTPFMFLILLAGLQRIPNHIIEAAKLDGASSWQLNMMIKIPYIKPILLFAILLRSIDAFKVLEVIFIMTFGGPGRATEVLSLHLYKIAFIGQHFGKAAALSIVFLLLSMVVSVIFFKVKKRVKLS